MNKSKVLLQEEQVKKYTDIYRKLSFKVLYIKSCHSRENVPLSSGEWLCLVSLIKGSNHSSLEPVAAYDAHSHTFRN
jgi:hypothetical protein